MRPAKALKKVKALEGNMRNHDVTLRLPDISTASEGLGFGSILHL
jgi:hypothetical protein